MNRKFDIRNRARLKSAERRKTMPPEKFLAAVPIEPGSVIVDIGCGLGYWAIPLAQRLGNGGKVYAADISEEMLEALQDEVDEAGVKNVEGVHSEESKIPLPDASVDVAFMSNVYHELEDRPAMLAEILRLLKPGGRFINLDWKKKETPSGPPLEIRLEVEEVKAELRNAGFENEQNAEIYDFFNVVWGAKAG